MRSRRSTAPLDAALEVADPAASHAELVVAADDIDRLGRLLDELTPDQRRVVELRLSGLVGNEIAQVTGRTWNAVDAIQVRAFKRLRRLGAKTLRGTPNG